ncbi:MAG TPA: YceI family protein [Saprospiraceae bacterium]|nr:YceI family protein [Saprospiraceae bacterium]MCB9270535.1 YceI family protein [Lewinellaceae bacterium]HPG08763.1 YceI family protein [Saprospiraceae bacterium]HPR00253.1 YceI family protein [Saprospiraceae bacterium]HQU52876.1 YceI family protein [Saprospiraceae bacterium]
MTTEKVTWKLDPAHSEITFKVKHMMISNVKGAFNAFQAEIHGEDFTKAKITTDIDAGSIDTNSADRDGHLKSADFFDVEKYPTLHFESSTFTKVSGDQYKLTGFLTMKDVRKEVSLDVEFGGINKDPWGNEKAGFSVEGKLNRKDWGLNWNAALETGGVLVSEEVRIQAELQFVKQVA